MDRDVHDPEWLVRKRRIDPILDSLGWSRQTSLPATGAARVKEYESINGPADYALGLDGDVLGVVEAKKLTLGPQNVLTQAERYSKGATSNPLNFNGYRFPSVYCTDGELICFLDADQPRRPLPAQPDARVPVRRQSRGALSWGLAAEPPRALSTLEVNRRLFGVLLVVSNDARMRPCNQVKYGGIASPIRFRIRYL